MELVDPIFLKMGRKFAVPSIMKRCFGKGGFIMLKWKKIEVRLFHILCFALCTVFVIGCGTQKTASEDGRNEVEIEHIYIYKQDTYEKVDMQDKDAIKVKDAVSKILKEDAASLEGIDGSVIWGKAEEKKELKEEVCYIEIVFKDKENVNVADKLSYNNITAMLVNVSENVIYLSQEEDVLESGKFGIGLAVPDESMEEYFYGISK